MAQHLYAYSPAVDLPEFKDDYNQWLRSNSEIIEGAPLTIVPQDQANLILSLCDDGYHRPALDIDYPCEIGERFGERLLFVDKRNDFEGVLTVGLDQFGNVELVPSSTEGHFHLYGDRIYTAQQYMKLIRCLGTDHRFIGHHILGYRYVELSMERGFTALRVPGHKKTIADIIDEAVKPRGQIVGGFIPDRTAVAVNA